MSGRDGYLLAIDVGTTTTRCVLFDLAGKPVAEAYREPKVHHPRPNWTEVEPEDWWACTVVVIHQVLDRAQVSGKGILGVGLCGLKHALVPIDKSGVPLARSMLWMDQRCQPQAEWLTQEYGDLIRERVGGGGVMSTTPSAPKLRWIVENEPDLLRQAHKFLLAKDFIRLRLTGTVATDPSDAGGTRLYDARSGDWSWQLLELIGVPREKMPPIHASTQIAGGVTGEAARVTGLVPGTPVVVGGGDVRCTLVGANALESARACLYLGTAAWISLPPPRSADDRLSAGRFGATATTGAALKWLVTLFDRESPDSPSASYASLLQEARGVSLGARGLVFIPHLMGERGPRCDPKAKGTLFGLTLAHTRSDIARAVLEGCACQLRYILEELGPGDVDELVAVGGGAKSSLWLSIIADVTGVALLVPQVLEAGALGAAIYAGVGVGVYPGIREAAEELVQIVGLVRPHKARHQLYESLYGIFVELEGKVSPLYERTPVGEEQVQPRAEGEER